MISRKLNTFKKYTYSYKGRDARKCVFRASSLFKLKSVCSATKTNLNMKSLHEVSKDILSAEANNKGDDQADLRLCCPHATESSFLVTRPIFLLEEQSQSVVSWIMVVI